MEHQWCWVGTVPTGAAAVPWGHQRWDVALGTGGWGRRWAPMPGKCFFFFVLEVGERARSYCLRSSHPGWGEVTGMAGMRPPQGFGLRQHFPSALRPLALCGCLYTFFLERKNCSGAQKELRPVGEALGRQKWHSPVAPACSQRCPGSLGKNPGDLGLTLTHLHVTG